MKTKLYWVQKWNELQDHYSKRLGYTERENALDFILAYSKFCHEEEDKHKKWLLHGTLFHPTEKSSRSSSVKKDTNSDGKMEKSVCSVKSATDSTQPVEE